MSDDLLLGELTPEARKFLQALGRDVPHVYTGPPAPTKRISRHVVCDPHTWSPLTLERFPELIKRDRAIELRFEIETEYELGMRVTNALRHERINNSER